MGEALRIAVRTLLGLKHILSGFKSWVYSRSKLPASTHLGSSSTWNIDMGAQAYGALTWAEWETRVEFPSPVFGLAQP